MRQGLSIFASAALVSVAAGDVFVQVTRTGELPTGLEDSCVIGESGSYDVWMWSDVPGVRLSAFSLRIGSPGASSRVEWAMSGVGIVDPDGLFSPLASFDGSVVDSAIVGIEMIQFFGLPGVEIGPSPVEAIRLYSGALGTNVEVGGRLIAEPANLETDIPFGVVRLIGITQTPSPGVLCGMGLWGLVCAGRRRRGCGHA